MPLHHISMLWPHLSYIVPEVSRGNMLKQTAGGYAHTAYTVSGNNANDNLKLCT